MTKRICKVCKTPFCVQSIAYFHEKSGRTFLRESKSTTCSKKCADYSKGTSTRKPHAKCYVEKCSYFGKVIGGLCPKHFQYFWRNGAPTRPIRKPKPLNLSVGWKMWIAGVIDCEGWIGLTQMKRANGICYCPGVGVGNTNRLLTDKLKSLTGLGYCMERSRAAPAKDITQWSVTKRDEVEDLLVTIRPYLILKGAQADLLLSLPPIHAKDNATRAAIKAKLTVLNRKGVA